MFALFKDVAGHDRTPRPSPAVLLLWAVAAFLAMAGLAGRVMGSPARTEAPPATASTAPAPAAAALAAPVEVSAPSGPTPQIVARDSLGSTPLSARIRAFGGLLLLAFLAWACSVDRSRVHWRVVLWGIGLQLLFGAFILKTGLGEGIFGALNDVVVALLGFTVEGARFVFGDLVYNNVPVGMAASGTNEVLQPLPDMAAHTGGYFAFNVLPTIIFFSSLMTVLYHLGIMQWVVKGVAWVMVRTMRTSGAETLSAAGNIFVGQTEAPLLVKPFVERMTSSELMAVMTGGFSTVAGGVLAAYVGMLVAYFPDIAGHLMAASVMSAPAALVVAKLMVPEDGEPETAGTLDIEVDKPDVNVIDAAARGASDGLGLALNVGAMLLAFIALVYLLNAVLGWMGGVVGFDGLTMEWLLGRLLWPVAWMVGVEAADAGTVASLLGVKTVLNEFVAYLQLAGILGGEGGAALSPRSAVIATYALSGFANFSSIAVQLGGIGGIAPSRRHDLSRLGMRAMIAGTMAALMTAAVAGMLV
ncbi:MAG TPA: nucleoside transporter C-terminal domain-containing protein [Longimicrobiales bacterium]|jgi:CNT family concentrative nucleoside transporter